MLDSDAKALAKYADVERALEALEARLERVGADIRRQVERSRALYGRLSSVEAERLLRAKRYPTKFHDML